jgi:hypothetical protein
MRRVIGSRSFACLVISVACSVLFSRWSYGGEEKLKPEDVVAKHLQALGSPEARAAIKTRTMNGVAEVAFLQGEVGRLSGGALFTSDAGRTALELRFGNTGYEADQLIFDGKNVLVGNMRPGVRSPLGTFIHDYASALLKEGVLGGVTNVGWALASDRKLRLNYRGLKKLEGHEVHVLRYQSKRADLKIDLGFDPQTFRHVVTECSLEIPPSGVDRPDAAPSRDTIWRVSEEFEDFKEVDGITLPLSYKVRVNYEGAAMTFIGEWKAIFSEVRHNQDLDPTAFALR